MIVWFSGDIFPESASEGFLLCMSSAGAKFSFPAGVRVRCGCVAGVLRSHRKLTFPFSFSTFLPFSFVTLRRFSPEPPQPMFFHRDRTCQKREGFHNRSPRCGAFDLTPLGPWFLQ